MESTFSQKTILDSELFRIPIEEYEEAMETESAKGKKKDILDLLVNSNKLRSEKEYEEIKDKLYEACKTGDLKLIKICLNESIEDLLKSFIFKIDRTNQTASLFKVKNDTEELLIPRAFHHESIEYLITSIISINNTKIKTIKFSEDSAVEIIYGNAFCNTRFTEIYFPASLKELKNSWCNDTYNLNKIGISPLNGQFQINEDKYLLGKSDQNSDEFDTLLFACRDIKEISIPPNIKVISSYAFQFCKKMTYVNIPENSNLQTIESSALSFSNIYHLYIPANLRELKEGWNIGLENLREITISPLNGQFQISEDEILLGKSDQNSDEFDILLFACRDITEIYIPPNIKIISPRAFQYCHNLTYVEIPEDSNLEIIGSRSFYSSRIYGIFIPSKVKKICECAFYSCFNLQIVEFADDINLQAIEPYAFTDSDIREFYFPANISEISEGLFYKCDKLNIVEIPTDSNIQKISEKAFARSNIEEIFIPSKVTEICEGAFSDCKNLKKVVIPTDSNLQTIGCEAFYESNIEEIFIPSKVSKICKEAFRFCRNLSKVEIPADSALQIIGKFSFYKSNIEDIFIPSKMTEICESAFCVCQNLKKVEIPTDSNLQTIKKYAFSASDIKSFFITSNVSFIGENAFYNCKNLNIIEISEESKLKSFSMSVCKKCPKLIVMIPSSLKIDII